MIGGIIADLARNTWQTDKDIFYKGLISPQAQLSNYGLYAMDVANALILKEKFNYRMYRYRFDFNSFEEEENLITIPACLAAWTTDDEHEAYRLASSIGRKEKAGFYSLRMLIPLIIALRNGASKDQALASLEEYVRSIMLDWKKQEDNAIAVVTRAWDAFYRWYDFTSVIHSAVKSPVNPKLTAIIAGFLAESMYGCRLNLVKRKYSKNFYDYIQIPKEYNLIKIREYDSKQSKFFPKNHALTNVEWHFWSTCLNPYEGKLFAEDTYFKIQKAFETGYEDRYVIYLDNGWFYIYRSGYLLLRFKIDKSDQRYLITKVQLSGEKNMKESLMGMVCAIESAQSPFPKNDPIILKPNEPFNLC